MIKVIFRMLALLAAIVTLVKCDHYEYPISPYPRIETLPVINISDTSVTFQAKVTQLGTLPITNHGFVWGMDKYPVINSNDNIQQGAITSLGDFEADITEGMEVGKTYYVKAFVVTNDYFVYGDIVSFTSKGGIPPVITSFSPREATLGDTIIIKGKYFSGKPLGNDVKFGTVKSKIITSNDSTIECIVPNNIPNTVPIFVTSFGKKSQSSDDFIVAPPSISDYTPITGTFDDIVTITGTYFSSIKENVVVKFNEFDAEVIEFSKTQIKVKVPIPITTKETSVSVTINKQVAASPIKFAILPPLINSISSNQGLMGNTIRINGKNFNPGSYGTKILFGERSAVIMSLTKASIVVEVPTGIYNTRTFKIKLTVAEQSALSGDFTLKDAWIRKADLSTSDLPGIGPSRYAASAFAIDGIGYAGLGGDGIDNAFFAFDPTQNTWSKVAPYPGGARGYSASFVIEGKGYVGMGISATPSIRGGVAKSEFWRFDPLSNSWESIASIPVASGIASYGFSRNRKGYVVTNSQSDNFWQYDPATDTWEKKGDIPLIQSSYVADCGFVVGDRIFIIAGDQSGSYYNSQMWEYDFTTNTWVQRTKLPGYIRGYKGFSLNGYGYVKFGNYLYKYDPNANSWSDLNCPANIGGLNPIEFVIGNKAYYGTGNNGVGVDVWEYDPSYQR